MTDCTELSLKISHIETSSNLLGPFNRFIIWVYGDDTVSSYNGVVILGNHISQYCVKEENNLRFTEFNRTLSDAFANEPILDMQGITEALSKYYYSNNESFAGLSIAPQYQERFEKIAYEAIDYYAD